MFLLSCRFGYSFRTLFLNGRQYNPWLLERWSSGSLFMYLICYSRLHLLLHLIHKSISLAFLVMSYWQILDSMLQVVLLFMMIHNKNNTTLLYERVLQGLGTTEFMNLIGWNRYWLRSISYLDLHLNQLHFAVKKVQTEIQGYWKFFLEILLEVPKSQIQRKHKENKQTLADLSSAHRRS